MSAVPVGLTLLKFDSLSPTSSFHACLHSQKVKIYLVKVRMRK
jgi:hypothetical protein